MLHIILRVIGIFGLVVLLAMMNMTSPTGVGPLGVLVFFTTLYFVCYELVREVVKVVYKIMARKWWGIKDEAYAAALAFAPILALFLKSFSGFSMFGMGLIVMFEVLVCFLIAKKL